MIEHHVIIAKMLKERLEAKNQLIQEETETVKMEEALDAFSPSTDSKKKNAQHVEAKRITTTAPRHRKNVKKQKNFQKAGKRVLLVANHTSLLDVLFAEGQRNENVH